MADRVGFEHYRSKGTWPLPRENVYTCEKCHKWTVTVDVAYGTTPFIINCRASGKEGDCEGHAYSSCYPHAPRPSFIPAPAWEWYKPSKEEYDKLSEGIKDHVKMGGLLIRLRTDCEPIMHSI